MLLVGASRRCRAVCSEIWAAFYAPINGRRYTHTPSCHVSFAPPSTLFSEDRAFLPKRVKGVGCGVTMNSNNKCRLLKKMNFDMKVGSAGGVCVCGGGLTS